MPDASPKVATQISKFEKTANVNSAIAGDAVPDIENIHELLDVVEETIAELERDKRDEVDVTDYSEFCLAVNDVLGYTAYSDVQPQLGINSTILNKFIKFRGRLPKRTVRSVADRLRTYLRSLDQATFEHPHARTPPAPPKSSPKKPKPKPPAPPAFTITAEEWKLVQPTSEVKLKIVAISSLLDAIINQLQRSNAPPDGQLLSEIERAQLIAVLETALLVLKAPIIEKGLLTKTKDVLKRTAAQAAEKSVQQGMGNAAGEASRLIWEVIKSMF